MSTIKLVIPTANSRLPVHIVLLPGRQIVQQKSQLFIFFFINPPEKIKFSSMTKTPLFIQFFNRNPKFLVPIPRLKTLLTRSCQQPVHFVRALGCWSPRRGACSPPVRQIQARPLKSASTLLSLGYRIGRLYKRASNSVLWNKSHNCVSQPARVGWPMNQNCVAYITENVLTVMFNDSFRCSLLMHPHH